MKEKIKNIWKEVLGFGDISLDANFYGLGGDSIKAARLMSRINEEFGLKLPVTFLSQGPSIKSFITNCEDLQKRKEPIARASKISQ